jgi:hypothetical protein
MPKTICDKMLEEIEDEEELNKLKLETAKRLVGKDIVEIIVKTKEKLNKKLARVEDKVNRVRILKETEEKTENGYHYFIVCGFDGEEGTLSIFFDTEEKIILPHIKFEKTKQVVRKIYRWVYNVNPLEKFYKVLSEADITKYDKNNPEKIYQFFEEIMEKVDGSYYYDYVIYLGLLRKI